jgi:hypothetical protein
VRFPPLPTAGGTSELVGAHETSGRKLAERLTPPAYIAWSQWLIATGIAVLV